MYLGKWETVAFIGQPFFFWFFNYLVSVTGQGTTRATETYSFLHESPFAAVNYYRLKQIDFDGTYSYSKIRSIGFNAENGISLYPNPANDVIKIEGLSAGVKAVVEVCDANGRIVIRPQTMDSGSFLNLEKLKTGIYYIRVCYDKGDRFSHRFVKGGHL